MTHSKSNPAKVNQAAVAQVFDNGVIKQASELKTGEKVFLPPTDRNKEVILETLRPFLDESEHVLEVGSGSGQHIFHFAKAYPNVVFQPSEYDISLFSSIEAYTADLDSNHRVLRPLELDTTEQAHWQHALKVGRQERCHNKEKSHWAQNNHQGEAYDLVIATNIYHITSWEVGSNLVRGAGQVLRTGGYFVTYGAFKKDGKFSTESNEQFDQTLRSRDPTWGVRDIEAIQNVAEQESNMRLVKIENMPSNNYLLVFQKLELDE